MKSHFSCDNLHKPHPQTCHPEVGGNPREKHKQIPFLCQRIKITLLEYGSWLRDTYTFM